MKEYGTAQVEVGGEVVTFTEPDWIKMRELQGVILPDFSDPIKFGDGTEAGKMFSRFLLAPFSDAEVTAGVLACLSDHDKEWFLTPGRLSGEDMTALIEKGLTPVFPFGLFKSIVAVMDRFAEGFLTSSGASGSVPPPSSDGAAKN
jgi:hypothetical protein